MIIKRVCIENLGILPQQEITNFSAGCNIFLGPNEAGKSTTFNFFRAMFFGSTRAIKQRELILPSTTKKNMPVGGTLFLESQKSGNITFVRHPLATGKSKGVEIYLENGTPLGESEFFALVGNINVDVFDNVFALSLEQLMSVATLKKETVRDALHAATFGLATASPAQVITLLKTQTNELLKEHRATNTAPINALIIQLEDVRNQINALGKETTRLEALTLERESNLQNRALLYKEQQELTHKKHSLERFLHAYPQYEELLRIRGLLTTLAQENPTTSHTVTFSPDALTRFETLLTRQEELATEQITQEKQKETLHAELAVLQNKTLLAELAPALHTIQTSVESRKKDAATLPQNAVRKAQLKTTITDGLTLLRWDVHTLEKSSLSLEMRNNIRNAHKALADASEKVHLAEHTEKQLVEDLSQLEKTILFEKNNLPLVQELPTIDVADAMHATIAEAKNSLQSLQQLHNQREEQEQTLAQTLAPISILSKNVDPTATQKDTPKKTFSPLLEQEKLQLQQVATEYIDAQKKLEKVQDDLQRLYTEYGEEEALAPLLQTGKKIIIDAQTLEQRAHTVKRLEYCLLKLNNALDQHAEATRDFDELTQQYPAQKTPTPLWQSPYLVMSLFFGAVALALGGTAFFFKEPLAGYGCMGTAFMSLFSSILYFIERKDTQQTMRILSPEVQRVTNRLHKAQNLQKNLTEQYTTLLHSIEEWAPFTCAHKVDEADIRGLNSYLEKERMHFFTHQQTLHEQDQAEQRLAVKKQEVEIFETRVEEATQQIQDYHEHWCTLLQRIHLSPHLLPEQLSFVLERLETAKSYTKNLENLQKNITHTAQNLQRCLYTALEQPFFTQSLQSVWPQTWGVPEHFCFLKQGNMRATQKEGAKPPALLFVAPEYHKQLQECTVPLQALETALQQLRVLRQQEQDWHTKNSLLQEKQRRAEDLQNSLKQCQSTLEQSRLAHTNIQKKWTDWLLEHELSASFTPTTANEALTTISETKKAVQEKNKLQEEQHLLTQNIQDYIQSIGTLALQAHLDLPEKYQSMIHASKEMKATLAINAEMKSLLKSAEETGVYETTETTKTAKATETTENTPEAMRNKAEIAPLIPSTYSLTFTYTGTAQEDLPDFLHILQKLTASIETAHKALTRSEALQEQSVVLDTSISTTSLHLKQVAEKIGFFLDSANVVTHEDFRKTFALWQQQEEYKKSERECLASLTPLATQENKSLPVLLDIFAQKHEREMQQERAELEEKNQELTEQLENLNIAEGTLQENLRQLGSGIGVATLYQEEAFLEESLTALIKKWKTFFIAQQLLSKAKAHIEQTGQQGVIGFASELFCHITKGEYVRIYTEENDTFVAVHKNGVTKDVDTALSQGTKEQLYLALRLAYIKNNAQNAEPMPVFMDDILVNADPKRAAHLASVLADFALDNQIFYFTCHPQTAELLYSTAYKKSSQHSELIPKQYSIDAGLIAQKM